MDKDIVEEARALLVMCRVGPNEKITNAADSYLFDAQGPRLLRALADEVERLRKQAVGIKPLEWERVDKGNPFWIAKPLSDVQYQVGWVGGDLPIRWLKVGVREADGRCASPEEGKQLAEQHWKNYIQQALEPVEIGEGA